MDVREFTREDKQVFMELCEMFYHSSVALREFDRERTEKTFARVMDRHENLWGYLFFDKDMNLPIGYALVTSYWSNEEGGEVVVLDELFLNPINRSKGYAALFMNWMEEHFAGSAAITLEVLSDNLQARKFYEKMGFHPDGYISYDKKLRKPLPKQE